MSPERGKLRQAVGQVSPRGRRPVSAAPVSVGEWHFAVPYSCGLCAPEIHSIDEAVALNAAVRLRKRKKYNAWALREKKKMLAFTDEMFPKGLEDKKEVMSPTMQRQYGKDRG